MKTHAFFPGPWFRIWLILFSTRGCSTLRALDASIISRGCLRGIYPRPSGSVIDRTCRRWPPFSDDAMGTSPTITATRMMN